LSLLPSSVQPLPARITLEALKRAEALSPAFSPISAMLRHQGSPMKVFPFPAVIEIFQG
jgi:hypothetical protein